MTARPAPRENAPETGINTDNTLTLNGGVALSLKRTGCPPKTTVFHDQCLIRSTFSCEGVYPMFAS